MYRLKMAKGLQKCLPNEHLDHKENDFLTFLLKINCHNGFSLDLDDHKNKWSRHRSFLYGCDQSPGIHVFKLGIEIPNLKQSNWSTKNSL